MSTYEFRGMNGDYVTVESTNEQDARHKAMVSRWGQPTGMYSDPYQGRGLSLVKINNEKV